MAENKSSNYDWFKGKNNQSQKDKRKDGMKTTWKFTKIFLFFSLFFFSMWGCVQQFIMKTDKAVGRGSELYVSAENIAPQVHSVHITKNAPEIYKVSVSTDNIWINHKEDPRVLREIHQELKDQGVASLDQANKGGNIVQRIVTEGGLTNPLAKPEEKYVVRISHTGNPLALSTASTKDGSLLLPALTGEFKFFTVKSDDSVVVANTLDKRQPGSFDLSMLNPVNNNNRLAGVPNKTEDPKAYRSYMYNLQYVNALLQTVDPTSNESIKDWLAKDLSTTIPSSATHAEKKQIVDAHNSFVGFIIQSLGVKYSEFMSVHWRYSNHIVGFASNKYTPVATWGQAWAGDRGAGPFYGLFVYPISWLTNHIVDGLPMMSGWESFWAIVLTVLIIQLFIFAISFKSIMQQAKMQELNAKKAVIDAKYANYKGNKQMEARQRQEVQDLYKKEGVNPMASIAMLFVTMPFLISMWRVIGSIQHLKGTTWLGINFAATSWKELFAGHWNYLWLLVLTGGLQIFSQLYPRLLTRRRDKLRTNVHQKAAMKKNNKSQNIMMVVFTFITLIFSAGLQVYFIIRSLWTIGQHTTTHHIINAHKKARVKKAKA